MARVEAAHVSAHGDDTGLLLDFRQRFCIRHAVGDRDFDQHMLAGAHHLLALAAVHLSRSGEDNGIGTPNALAKVAAPVRDAVFLRDLRGRILIAADQRYDFDIRNTFQGVEMLLTERALAGYANLHRLLLTMSCLAFWAAARFGARSRADDGRLLLVLPWRFSRMICPTAVLDAGTV